MHGCRGLVERLRLGGVAGDVQVGRPEGRAGPAGRRQRAGRRRAAPGGRRPAPRSAIGLSTYTGTSGSAACGHQRAELAAAPARCGRPRRPAPARAARGPRCGGRRRRARRRGRSRRGVARGRRTSTRRRRRRPRGGSCAGGSSSGWCGAPEVAAEQHACAVRRRAAAVADPRMWPADRRVTVTSSVTRHHVVQRHRLQQRQGALDVGRVVQRQGGAVPGEAGSVGVRGVLLLQVGAVAQHDRGAARRSRRCTAPAA